MGDSVHLAELKRLVPTLPEIVTTRRLGWVHYKVESGACFGFGLYAATDGSVTVQQSFARAGTVLALHQHEDRHETLVVHSGTAEVQIGDEVYPLTAGRPCYIPPNTPHTFRAHEDCLLIAVMVPGSEGYPNAGA